MQGHACAPCVHLSFVPILLSPPSCHPCRHTSAAGRGALCTSSCWAPHVAARTLPSSPWAWFLLHHSAHAMSMHTHLVPAPTKCMQGLPASPSPWGSLVSSGSRVNPLVLQGCPRGRASSVAVVVTRAAGLWLPSLAQLYFH